MLNFEQRLGSSGGNGAGSLVGVVRDTLGVHDLGDGGREIDRVQVKQSVMFVAACRTHSVVHSAIGKLMMPIQT